MKNYPHMTTEEFLEIPDEKGIPRVNPLKEIYGEYIQNFRPFFYLQENLFLLAKEFSKNILEAK